MVLPFYLLTLLPVSAQTFTQRIQQHNTGEGTVTIHQEQTIDDLVNGTHSSTPTKTVSKPATKPATTKQRTTPATQQTAVTPAANETTEQTISPDTIAKPKRTHKAIGYRIQAFTGGNTRSDRQKAEKTGNTLKQLFPEDEVYVHFYSPRWICRIGNYRTYEEAKEKVAEIRKLGYESATIVKGKINVAE